MFLGNTFIKTVSLRLKDPEHIYLYAACTLMVKTSTTTEHAPEQLCRGEAPGDPRPCPGHALSPSGSTPVVAPQNDQIFAIKYPKGCQYFVKRPTIGQITIAYMITHYLQHYSTNYNYGSTDGSGHTVLMRATDLLPPEGHTPSPSVQLQGLMNPHLREPLIRSNLLHFQTDVCKAEQLGTARVTQ